MYLQDHYWRLSGAFDETQAELNNNLSEIQSLNMRIRDLRGKFGKPMKASTARTYGRFGSLLPIELENAERKQKIEIEKEKRRKDRAENFIREKHGIEKKNLDLVYDPFNPFAKFKKEEDFVKFKKDVEFKKDTEFGISNRNDFVEFKNQDSLEDFSVVRNEWKSTLAKNMKKNPEELSNLLSDFNNPLNQSLIENNQSGTTAAGGIEQTWKPFQDLSQELNCSNHDGNMPNGEPAFPFPQSQYEALAKQYLVGLAEREMLDRRFFDPLEGDQSEFLSQVLLSIDEMAGEDSIVIESTNLFSDSSRPDSGRPESSARSDKDTVKDDTGAIAGFDISIGLGRSEASEGLADFRKKKKKKKIQEDGVDEIPHEDGEQIRGDDTEKQRRKEEGGETSEKQKRKEEKEKRREEKMKKRSKKHEFLSQLNKLEDVSGFLDPKHFKKDEDGNIMEVDPFNEHLAKEHGLSTELQNALWLDDGTFESNFRKDPKSLRKSEAINTILKANEKKREEAANEKKNFDSDSGSDSSSKSSDDDSNSSSGKVPKKEGESTSRRSRKRLESQTTNKNSMGALPDTALPDAAGDVNAIETNLLDEKNFHVLAVVCTVVCKYSSVSCTTVSRVHQ